MIKRFTFDHEIIFIFKMKIYSFGNIDTFLTEGKNFLTQLVFFDTAFVSWCVLTQFECHNRFNEQVSHN